MGGTFKVGKKFKNEFILFTERMKNLMDNHSNREAPRGSQVDNLPVAFVLQADIGKAVVRWILAIPHVGEDQVRAMIAFVHLSDEGDALKGSVPK